jgi:predicted TIM-barrel fold metal-dependent hydrolase
MDRDTMHLSDERILDPSLPIVDPHHHLYPDAEPPYVLDDLRADIARCGARVVASVYVEAGTRYRTEGPVHLRSVGETAYVAGAADAARSTPDAAGLLAGIVASADLLLGRAVLEVLEAHAVEARGRLRGVRHVVAYDPDPSILRGRNRAAGLLTRPEFAEGVAAAAGAGLTVETWCYMHQLPDLVQLARAHPDVPLLVDHLGGPLALGRFAGRREESLAQVRRCFTELARLERVHLKLGGIGMDVVGSHWIGRPGPVSSEEVAAEWSDTVHWCIDTFGPDRCMFESNFPVDRHTTPYGVLWNAFLRMAVPYAPDERAALFAGTAARFYRLDDVGGLNAPKGDGEPTGT